MKRASWKLLGLLHVIAFSLLALPQTARSADLEFDPDNRIQESTNLPEASPVDITVNVTQWALGILGLVGVVMVIWGGFTYMTAAGNEERIKKAKQVLSAAVIGLVIILIAWSLVLFVYNTAREATT